MMTWEMLPNRQVPAGQKPMSGEYVIEIFLNDPTDFRLSSGGVTQPNELIYNGSIRNGKMLQLS